MIFLTYGMRAKIGRTTIRNSQPNHVWGVPAGRLIFEAQLGIIDVIHQRGGILQV